MFKFYVAAVMLLMAIGISGEAFCQQAHMSGHLMSTAGKITQVDTESGVISVATGHGEVVFQIMTESNLFISTHHMTVLEIEKGDPVIIDYVVTLGKNNVIRLVDNRGDR